MEEADEFGEGSVQTKEANDETEKERPRNPPPYALTPSKGTTTHGLLRAHTLRSFFLRLEMASRQIVCRYADEQKNELTIVSERVLL